MVNAVLEGGILVTSETLRSTDFMGRLVVAWLRTANSIDTAKLRNLPVSLQNLDLTHADLRGCDFGRLTLDGTDFSGANLAGARFIEASLRGCKLVGCNVRNAVFKSADLDGAVLCGIDADRAEFQWSSMHRARLAGANLTRANLNYAKLKGALYDPTTDWPLSIVPDREGAVLEK